MLASGNQAQAVCSVAITDSVISVFYLSCNFTNKYVP